jgi:hypothetical protein
MVPVLKNDEHGFLELSWVWNSEFVVLNSLASKSSSQKLTIARLHHLSCSVNGSLILPLQSMQFSSVPTHLLPSKGVIADLTISRTWMITENVLCKIENSLVQCIHTNYDLRLKLPVFGSVREAPFPYYAAIQDPRM